MIYIPLCFNFFLQPTKIRTQTIEVELEDFPIIYCTNPVSEKMF